MKNYSAVSRSHDETENAEPSSPHRRAFLGKVAGTAMAAGIVGLSPLVSEAGGGPGTQEIIPQAAVGPVSGRKRERQAERAVRLLESTARPAVPTPRGARKALA
jgi:hypothetical protein